MGWWEGIKENVSKAVTPASWNPMDSAGGTGKGTPWSAGNKTQWGDVAWKGPTAINAIAGGSDPGWAGTGMLAGAGLGMDALGQTDLGGAQRGADEAAYNQASEPLQWAMQKRQAEVGRKKAEEKRITDLTSATQQQGNVENSLLGALRRRRVGTKLSL